MKKIYLLMTLFLCALFTNAQITVQGVPRNDLSGKNIKKLSKKASFTMDDIVYWVGTGSKKAAFVVQWNDGKTPDALVWGYKWDGAATGEDMLKAIAKADKRFFSLLYPGTQYGTAIGGLGFDLDGNDSNALIRNGNVTYPLYPINGIINTSDYDFENYTAKDTDDHWFSGWLKGYWSYFIKDSANADFTYASVGASSRQLADGSWDLWNAYVGMSEYPISATLTPVSAYSPQADFTKGFFMVNEEWFGHTNGSVNYLEEDGQIYYRVYSQANENQAFGATTQFGTIYGDKFFFVSKQQADGGDVHYTPGGRLVIADAKTMKKIAGLDDIGGGDGRSYLGVDEHTGYIGASNGIAIFNTDNLSVGSIIPGTGGGGQIGNMIRTSQYVFAVKQAAGVLIIDPKTHTVVKTLAGNYQSIAQARDGSIWAIQDKKLVNIHPTTFETAEYAIPTTKYITAWGAWNAGSFTYSTRQNALFWINSISEWNNGKKIVKFDVGTRAFNEDFAAIPGQDSQYKQIPYGAALRIDPVSDELILNTTESGYGAHYQKNWVYTFSNTGALIKTQTLNDYYWFPAVTVFPDNYAPVIGNDLPSEISLNAAQSIDLKNAATDADNLSAAIVKTVKSNSNPAAVSAEINLDDRLVLTPLKSGISTVVLSFNSNGKLVEKAITVNVSDALATAENAETLHLEIYPNPATDLLNIRTAEKIIAAAVYDMAGHRAEARLSGGQIRVSALPKGTYILSVQTDKGIYREKFIKK